MTRGLILADGLAAVIAAMGIALLAKPTAAARLLRVPAGEAATYGLRIGGAMLLAAALFLAGFSTAFYLATAP